MNRISKLGLTALAGLGLATMGTMAVASPAIAPGIKGEFKDPTLTARLTGATEVPGPGAKKGGGMFSAYFMHDNTQICYKLTVHGIANPTMAHIHMGKAGTAGNVVRPLKRPILGKVNMACLPISSKLATQIKAHPSDFYVNVHNAPHPAGALRGQLMRAK